MIPGQHNGRSAIFVPGAPNVASFPYLAYLTKGKGIANGQIVSAGDLIRGEELSFEATEKSQLITVYLLQSMDA